MDLHHKSVSLSEAGSQVTKQVPSVVEPSKKRRGAWCSSGRAETRPEELLPGPDLC